MASATNKEVCPRRLAELLDEQQEPFVLEIYLLERGYCKRKSLELQGTVIGCCSSSTNHKQFLKKSSRYRIGSHPTSRKSSAQFSSFARSVLDKLVPRKGRRTKRKDREVVKPAGRCFSASCSTTLVNNTWSETDTDGDVISMTSPVKDETTHKEPAPDRVMAQWKFVYENRQCSPDSVLDEFDLLQVIPVYHVRKPPEGTPVESSVRFQKEVCEDAILSASLCEPLVQIRENPNQQRMRKPFPEYMNSRKALQQNRQLLFDCVRDAVENAKQHKSSSREKGLKMGPQEIGNFICRNLRAWGKLSADETNIKQVLRMDLLEDGWGSFEEPKREIVAEIGNCIIDDITEQIIRDMSSCTSVTVVI